MPCSSLCNEPRGGVENPLLAPGNIERGVKRRFCKGPLLFDKPARVNSALVVERQYGERPAEHADWGATIQLDDQVGHAHSLRRKDRQDMGIRIPQHPVEQCVRQAIEASILSDEKSTEGQAHRFTA